MFQIKFREGEAKVTETDLLDLQFHGLTIIDYIGVEAVRQGVPTAALIKRIKYRIICVAEGEAVAAEDVGAIVIVATAAKEI